MLVVLTKFFNNKIVYIKQKNPGHPSTGTIKQLTLRSPIIKWFNQSVTYIIPLRHQKHPKIGLKIYKSELFGVQYSDTKDNFWQSDFYHSKTDLLGIQIVTWSHKNDNFSWAVRPVFLIVTQHRKALLEPPTKKLKAEFVFQLFVIFYEFHS